MATTALTDLAFDPDLVPIETLDEEIVSLAARMTAQEYELLSLIRSFDERGGWLKWGSTSCAEWLHWRCDLSLSAAREKVRVAHALNLLPEISAAFATGRLSYSKARALTRVADAHNEAELLSFALQVSAALVEQRCQQLRNVTSESTRIARRAHERRSLSAFRNGQKNTMTVTVELPLEEGELLLNTLDRVLEQGSQSADASTSYRARQADALIALCRDAHTPEQSRKDVTEGESCTVNADKSLRGGIGMDNVSQTTTSRSSRNAAKAASSTTPYQVIIHTDASALSGRHTEDPSSEGSAARSDLPVETVRRLCCDGNVVPISNDAKGHPLHIGRNRRTVSTALKRALLARDRHCRYPSCSHARFVDAHHIEHWAHGGETSLENLMLLCSHHHRLVHEGGFQIVLDISTCWDAPAIRPPENSLALTGRKTNSMMRRTRSSAGLMIQPIR